MIYILTDSSTPRPACSFSVTICKHSALRELLRQIPPRPALPPGQETTINDKDLALTHFCLPHILVNNNLKKKKKEVKSWSGIRAIFLCLGYSFLENKASLLLLEGSNRI